MAIIIVTPELIVLKFFKMAKQKFIDKCTEKYLELIKSKTSVQNGYCTLCKVDCMVKHGGINDCKRHVGHKRHKDLLRHLMYSITYLRTISTGSEKLGGVSFIFFLIYF